MALSPLDHACNRHRAFLEEVERLLEAEFPYTDSEEALRQIHRIFRAKLNSLEGNVGSRNDPAVIRSECCVALNDLFDYLPYLGYILRSTNVRNAFEVFRPLLHLAGDLLEPDEERDSRVTRLILTSEWDYAPVLYSEPAALDQFVFVGLPAPESSNPLLLPLAGHELGHAVWETRHLSNHFEQMATTTLVNKVRDHFGEFTRAFPRPGVTLGDIYNTPEVIGDWIGALPWALKNYPKTCLA